MYVQLRCIVSSTIHHEINNELKTASPLIFNIAS